MAEIKKGSLEAIVGPMFSGKTGEMIDQIERESYADLQAITFKPDNDTRYSPDKVVTHGGKEIDAFPINRENPDEILIIVRKIENDGRTVDIVGIDEGQFFTEGIIPVIEELVSRDIIIIVAGLPTDYEDKPFGSMPIIIAKADKIVQKTAKCTFRDPGGSVCGAVATKTQRLVAIPGQIVVGGAEMYAAHCRGHHHRPDESVPGKPGEKDD